jgi:VWFA-related protein
MLEDSDATGRSPGESYRQKPMTRHSVIAAVARVCAFAVACALFAVCGWGQGAPAGPLPPKPGVQPEPPPPAELQKRAIRSHVTEVTAPVTVTDPRTGDTVLDLTKTNFHVYDNGAEQKIEHFDLGGDSLSIVLVVETSSHVAAMLPAIRQSGIVFTETVMGQTSEAAVIGYDDTVDVLQNFTTDVDAVQRVINNLPVGSSGMHLYDAMARGIQLLGDQPPAQRRIMVVIGEAQDSGSENKLGHVLRRAQLTNVTIYSLGLSTTAADLRQPAGQHQPTWQGPPGTYPVPGEQPDTPDAEAAAQGNMDLGALLIWLVKTGKNAVGTNALEAASKATGGLHVNAMRDKTIQKALDEIGGELHTQYTLGYRPAGDEPSGYHEIKVTVDRPGVTVRTRPGYYIPPPES